MSQSWKVGDVVALKSGSPALTVIGRATEGDVLCAYFKSGSDYVKVLIPADALEAVR